MIGFIALAGIIVRNSILLVDFVRHADPSKGLRDVLIEAGRDPLQADPAHRAGGDDRRGGDPVRPDLPGPGDLAAVRPRLLHGADRAGHSGDLCRAARRAEFRRELRPASAGRFGKLCGGGRKPAVFAAEPVEPLLDTAREAVADETRRQARPADEAVRMRSALRKWRAAHRHVRDKARRAL